MCSLFVLCVSNLISYIEIYKYHHNYLRNFQHDFFNNSFLSQKRAGCAPLSRGVAAGAPCYIFHFIIIAPRRATQESARSPQDTRAAACSSRAVRRARVSCSLPTLTFAGAAPAAAALLNANKGKSVMHTSIWLGRMSRKVFRVCRCISAAAC
jgi:hypothetical protein